MNLPLAPILALSLQGHRLNLKPSLLIWELHCPGAGRASVVKWINNREQLNQQAGKNTQLLLIWPWSWGGLDTVWNPQGWLESKVELSVCGGGGGLRVCVRSG